MTPRLILLGTALLLATSCQPPAAKPSVGSLTFRAECEEGLQDAVSETFDGRTSWFGPPQVFQLQYAGPTIDATGKPAIAFEVEEAGKAEFTAMTEQCINRALAMYIDGVFIWAPNVNSALPGQGVLNSGTREGWTAAERDAWLVRIKGS